MFHPVSSRIRRIETSTSLDEHAHASVEHGTRHEATIINDQSSDRKGAGCFILYHRAYVESKHQQDWMNMPTQAWVMAPTIKQFHDPDENRDCSDMIYGF